MRKVTAIVFSGVVAAGLIASSGARSAPLPGGDARGTSAAASELLLAKADACRPLPLEVEFDGKRFSASGQYDVVGFAAGDSMGEVDVAMGNAAAQFFSAAERAASADGKAAQTPGLLEFLQHYQRYFLGKEGSRVTNLRFTRGAEGTVDLRVQFGGGVDPLFSERSAGFGATRG